MMIRNWNPASGSARPVRPPAIANRSRGIAIVLVIVAVAAAAVIGSAYVASLLNAPQIVGNVNDGIEARYIADSGADLATAIMECKTIDWRTAQVDGVLVSNLPIGSGKVSIHVADSSGGRPDANCEYPVIVAKGQSGGMRQIVGMQAFSPVADKLAGDVNVDLGEFAVFGQSSVNVTNSWIVGWPASPLQNLGLPVRIGTNATTRGAVLLSGKDSAPDSVGYAMSTAVPGTFNTPALIGPPIHRVDYSIKEAIPLPAPPKPDLGNLLWATAKSPNITSDTTSTLTSDRRHNGLTIDNRATLTVDLGGATHTVAISGPLTIQNGGVLQINNGHLNLVVTGAFNMFNKAALALGNGASVTIWCGSTMSIDDSVIGLPAAVATATRAARKGLDTYYDPSLCTIYRINSITSVDLNLLDLDTAADWIWSDTNVRSWIVNTNSYVCGRIYGHSKVDFTLDNQSAVFGNVIARTVVIATQSAVFYDQMLNGGFGYTNPKSALYAAPQDLRDDVLLLLTDLNDSTIASILALVRVAPGPTPFDPFGPTPREKARVAARWWKRYGVQMKRDRQSQVETIISAEAR